MALGASDRYCNRAIGVLVSAIVHVGLCLLLISASSWEFVPPKPEEEMTVSELLMAPPPPLPEPPSPLEPTEPEPTEPEPAEPEPEPEPEPPKPEPPKPEPPKPEPPKPEPPKPEPPKPEPPKPEPPKPEPPKPKPKDRRQSIQERLREAKVHYGQQPKPVQRPRQRPVQPPVRSTSAEDYRRRWAERTQVEPVRPDALTGRLRQRIEAATPAEEAMNYGDQVVRPAFYEAWETPRTGGRTPQPVVVELDIASDGRVISSRITRRSNDDRMNQSVEELVRRIRRFTPFTQLGIRATSLHIVVTMTVED